MQCWFRVHQAKKHLAALKLEAFNRFMLKTLQLSNLAALKIQGAYRRWKNHRTEMGFRRAINAAAIARTAAEEAKRIVRAMLERLTHLFISSAAAIAQNAAQNAKRGLFATAAAIAIAASHIAHFSAQRAEMAAAIALKNRMEAEKLKSMREAAAIALKAFWTSQNVGFAAENAVQRIHTAIHEANRATALANRARDFFGRQGAALVGSLLYNAMAKVKRISMSARALSEQVLRVIEGVESDIQVQVCSNAIADAARISSICSSMASSASDCATDEYRMACTRRSIGIAAATALGALLSARYAQYAAEMEVECYFCAASIAAAQAATMAIAAKTAAHRAMQQAKRNYIDAIHGRYMVLHEERDRIFARHSATVSGMRYDLVTTTHRIFYTIAIDNTAESVWEM